MQTMEIASILQSSFGQITIITRRRLIESLGAAVFLAPFALAGTPEFLETEDNQEGPYYKKGAPKRWSLGTTECPVRLLS